MSALAVVLEAEVVLDDVEAARDLTTRTREALHTAAAAVEAALTLVAEARDTGAWAVLGYATFAAYAEAELVGLRDVRLAVDRRVQLVRGLLGEGLSKRAVGRVFGISDQTVRADEVRELEAAPVAVLDGRRLTQPQLALAALEAAGLDGLTYVELGRRYRSWPCPWAILARLHEQGRVARLDHHEPTGTRTHKGAVHHVYVALHAVEGREVEPRATRCRVSR